MPWIYGRSSISFSGCRPISSYLDVSDDHRVAIGVEEVLALGIGTQDDGLAALGARQSCVDVFCK